MNLKARFSTLLIIAVIFSFSACQQVERHNYSYQVMGTEMIVTVEAADTEAGKAAADKVNDEMQRLNSLLSTWDPKSPMSQINKKARAGWAEVDPEIYALLQESVTYAELTAGRYDITAGPLVRLWGFFAREERKPPEAEKIREAQANIGIDKVEFNDAISAIRFLAPEMEIDLGGIAKGYAVDKAIEFLEEADISAGLINLGGNIRFIGLPRGQRSWGIAIRDPRKKAGIVGVLALEQEFAGWGIASSGQYERFFIYEGKRYGHIIDPTIGYPVENVLGTTIVASDATRADALSTSAFLMGEGAAEAMIKAQKKVFGLVLLQRGESGLTIKISKELAGKFTLTAEDDVVVEEF